MTASVIQAATKAVLDNQTGTTASITSSANANWTQSLLASGASIIFAGSLFQSGVSPTITGLADTAGAMTVSSQSHTVNAVDFIGYKHNITTATPYTNTATSSASGNMYSRLSGLQVTGLVNAGPVTNGTGSGQASAATGVAVSTVGNIAAGTYFVVTDVTLEGAAPAVFSCSLGTGATQFGEEQNDAHIQGCGAWNIITAPGGAVITATWSITGTTGDFQANIAVFAVTGDVTVTLTGIAIVSARGTVAAAVAKALTGVAIPSGAGTMAAALAKTLTGQAAAGSPGTIAPAMSKALTGASSTATPGTVVPGTAKALAGVSGAASVGSLASVDRSVPLTGASSAAVPGTVTVVRSVAITGQPMAAVPGTVAAAIAVSLGGQAATLTAGTITFSSGMDVTVALTGIAAGMTPGALFAAIAKALTGASAAAAPGTVAPSSSIPLTGQPAAASPGAIVPALAKGLTGQPAAAAPGSVVPARSLNVTGAASLAVPGSLAPSLAAALSGAATGVTPGSMNPGRTVAVVGQSIASAVGVLVPALGVILAGEAAITVPGGVSASTSQDIALTGQRATFTLGIVVARITYPEQPEPTYSYEGQFASFNPRAQMLGGTGTLVAAPEGVAMGRFAWVDMTTGTAASARTAATQLLGFVVPQIANFDRAYFDRGRWWLRGGLPVTLLTRGDVWARFENGALAGQRVYARQSDGAAIAGPMDGCELTAWSVVTDADPGDLAIISPWSNYQ